MKKVIVGVIMVLFLMGCGGFQNDLTKMKANIKTGNFTITLYSGGQPVKIWHLKNGYVSTEKESDGYFFEYNGKIVRISGTVAVEEE